MADSLDERKKMIFGIRTEMPVRDLVGPEDDRLFSAMEPIGPVAGPAERRRALDESRPQELELRLSTPNAWKLWLNGELIFQRDEYHRGMQLDQYKMPVTLRPGKNDILVKACQNEQEESWTVEWQFQLRVCDATGTAVLPINKL